MCEVENIDQMFEKTLSEALALRSTVTSDTLDIVKK